MTTRSCALLFIFISALVSGCAAPAEPSTSVSSTTRDFHATRTAILHAGAGVVPDRPSYNSQDAVFEVPKGDFHSGMIWCNWSFVAPATQELRILVYDGDLFQDASTVAKVTGPSPLKIEVNETVARHLGGGQPHVTATPANGTVYAQQEVSVTLQLSSSKAR